MKITDEQLKIRVGNPTIAAIRRIAELKIEAFHLDCTIDEYLARCRAKTLEQKKVQS